MVQKSRIQHQNPAFDFEGLFHCKRYVQNKAALALRRGFGTWTVSQYLSTNSRHFAFGYAEVKPLSLKVEAPLCDSATSGSDAGACRGARLWNQPE
jgi:hypothetical protein